MGRVPSRPAVACVRADPAGSVAGDFPFPGLTGVGPGVSQVLGWSFTHDASGTGRLLPSQGSKKTPSEVLLLEALVTFRGRRGHAWLP